MLQESTELPRMTNFISRRKKGDLNLSVDSPPPPKDETNIVRLEPTVPSVASVFEINGERDWHDGLCACSNDWPHCALTAFFPCCMACREYKRQGEGCGTPLLFGLSIFPLTIRYRTKQNIKGSLLMDCLQSLFCYQCLLCRIHRDSKAVENSKEIYSLDDVQSRSRAD